MKHIFLGLLTLLVSVLVIAQETPKKTSKWSINRSGDLAVVSFSNVTRNGVLLNNVPRFTMFLNSGTSFNYALGRQVAFFTGITAKNLGLIYDDNDSVRFKRRVIMAGVPLGFKFGNRDKGTFFYIGAESGFVLNYKEKRFLNNEKTAKSNTWFSNQTPVFMPSFFAGYTIQHVGLKLHYFPQNFFNPDFETEGTRPFAGMESQVLFVSMSVDFNPPRRNRRY